ncbi:MAG: hypothetical protein Q9161_004059 [Pseudevernia consocians]
MSGQAKDFIASSKFDVLVPQATELGFEELFVTDGGRDGAISISSIKRRSLLYFGGNVIDESLRIYIILRTPYQDEATLKSYLNRLAVNLDIQARGSRLRSPGGHNTPRETSPSRTEDTLWSGNIDASEDPFIIVQEEEEHDSTRTILAIWTTRALLSRPRIRLHSPTIFFRLSATLKPDKEGIREKFKDPVLPSGVPGSINLLESLKGDPALNDVEPRLAASRLHGIIPQTHDGYISDGNLRVGTQMAFRGLPAISSRVRYSRSNGRAGRSSIIASLDIETGAFSDEDIAITHVNMQMSEGAAEDMGKALAPLLPLACRPKDNPTFLFRLTSSGPVPDAPQSSAKTVLITVHATVLVSETCRPSIEMRWKTGVDFSTALNPLYGAPADGNGLPASAREREASSESGSNEKRQRAGSVTDFGVSISFTAPKYVRVGEPFSWDVLVLNRSSRLRQLALVVIPRRRNRLFGTHSSKSSSSSVKGHKDEDFANAVIDENLLYAMQKSAGHEPTHVISLSTDIRIGYIYNRVPLLHALIFIIEMVIVSRLIAKFNSYYADKPVLTIMITNAVLGGIADTVAQSLTAIRARSRRNLGLGKDISDGIEMPDYDEKSPYVTDIIPHRSHGPPQFDFERLTRFMSYGFIMSPVQFQWFAFLSRAFPITKESATMPALQRVCFDQLIFAPIGLAAFFTFMTVTEGGGRRAVTRKFQEVYLPSLKANFLLWPAVQILNFRVIPLQFQIPFVSTVGIAWTAYLSLTNSSDDAPISFPTD